MDPGEPQFSDKSDQMRTNPLTEALEQRFREAISLQTFHENELVGSDQRIEHIYLTAADGRVLWIGRPALDQEAVAKFDLGLEVRTPSILELADGSNTIIDASHVYIIRNATWYERREVRDLDAHGRRVVHVELIPLQDYQVEGLSRDVLAAELNTQPTEGGSGEQN